MDDVWAKAIIALEKGDFSRLESMLGGPDGFDRQIVEWCENGRFESEPEMLAEALSCACMLGRAGPKLPGICWTKVLIRTRG